MSNYTHKMNISEAREKLAYALGNKIEIVSILKNFTSSDSVDLLWYDFIEECFVDKTSKTKIPIKFLESNSLSMIGEAYKNKTPYRSAHIHYDTHYDVAIDNPYKLDISAQLIYPVLSEDKIVGIIRFCKNRHTFHKMVLKKLQLLESSLMDIFSTEIDDRAARLNASFFSVDGDQIHSRLDTIRREIVQLSAVTHNPEVKKIIDKAQESINNICDYIHFSKDVIPIEKSASSKLHILIADDVHMNVKILHAMLKGDSDREISFAYDGIETLQKIERAKENETPVDILYLDHYMPGKLGLEIAQEIREAEKENSNHKMTIISITNDPSAIEEQKHLYDHHISKPFSKAAISSVMENFVTL